jgi:hypothetical protein
MKMKASKEEVKMCIYVVEPKKIMIELTMCESAGPYCIKIAAEMKRQMNEAQELPML